ncbi:aspartyl/glutamyl-tRNA amidotransferase subunit B [Nitzschia inconspicua]|uniref:Glutamyl-tRNA(Gln) amidotransferase subunit B, mitochondrial n=1 Tax=Nitzschia inconspicua TaxID=303405 RepID=A0A9K3KLI3_9STRA|nr:aspartyl/glutamyl-tRNA amidotransferase subunit B [Nitzschia inconspicua]
MLNILKWGSASRVPRAFLSGGRTSIICFQDGREVEFVRIQHRQLHSKYHHHHHNHRRCCRRDRFYSFTSSSAKKSLSTTTEWTVDGETGIVSHQGTPRYQTLLGLEIHAQLDISTKLFSGCAVGSSGVGSSIHNYKPNTSVFPLDMAVPGWLPRLSQEAVHAAVLSAAALHCVLPPVSRFERKHYFYADLPLGYQMTQQRWPLARNGVLHCQRPSNQKKKRNKNNNNAIASSSSSTTFSVSIDRIQLEQDTGKTILATNPRTQQKESLVDFNRAGQALIEIVFAPELTSPVDAATAVETLRLLLKHIGTCNGKLEEGSLRCDVNVSISPIDDNLEYEVSSLSQQQQHQLLLERAGNRVEVKNLNSLRQIQEAAKYEALRQAQAAFQHTPTAQETRTFDVKTGRTIVTRTKGGAKDYRFMPEPDLPPLVLDANVLDGMTVTEFIAARLPELPQDARERLQRDYGLSDYMATVVVGDPPAIAMFDEAMQVALSQLTDGEDTTQKQQLQSQKSKISEAIANLLCNELFALVREFETRRLIAEGHLDAAGTTSVQFSKITGTQLGNVVVLLLEGTMSNTMAKQLLRVLYKEHDELQDVEPRQIASDRGFALITDPAIIEDLCRKVIAEHTDELERYKLGGKFAKKITKFFLGKAMTASQGNAHPERLNEILMEVLEDIAPLED